MDNKTTPTQEPQPIAEATPTPTPATSASTAGFVDGVSGDDDLLINVDLNEIPDKEPFNPGEKLLTLHSVDKKESGKTPGYFYIRAGFKVENDEYQGLIFENITPPGKHMGDAGKRACKRNLINWMSVLGITEPKVSAFEGAIGNSFYAVCGEGDDYGPSIDKLGKPAI